MSNRSLKSDAAKGGKWTSLSAVVSTLVQLGQLSILGRLLGPESFGQMALMMVVVGLANSLADFGMGNYLIQVERVTKGLYWRVIALCALISAILMGLICSLASLYADYYNSPELTLPLIVLSFAVIMNSLGQVSSSILQKNFKFKSIAIIEIISITLGLTVSIYFVVNGAGIWGLVFGQVCVSTLKALLSFLIGLPAVRALPNGFYGGLRTPLSFGFLQTNERIFNFLSVNLDKLIVGKYLGEHALGLYSFAFQLMVRPILILNPIISRVLYPLFSHIKNDNIRLARGYLEIIRTSSLLLLPIYLILCISSYGIIYILMGSKWTEAAPLLSILSVLGALYSIGMPLGSLILAKGRADLALFLNILSFLLNISACFIGSQFGIQNVAMLMVMASALFLLPFDFYLRKKIINMSISMFTKSLKHLLVGFFGVLIISCILNTFINVNVFNSLTIGLLSIIVFYLYIKIFDPIIINSAINFIRNN